MRRLLIQAIALPLALILIQATCVPVSAVEDKPFLSHLPASVEFDEYGVPQITASTDEDLLYTLGYITASDRLTQMDFTRRSAYGTLAEVVGKQMIESDLLMRRLDLRKVAERDLQALTSSFPRTQSLLKAYSDGINAYVEENGLPPEYLFLPKFERWTPVDSLAIARQISFTLAEDFYTELSAYKSETFAMEKRLNPTIPFAPYPIIESADERVEAYALSGALSVGSNAFVVSGDFTADGYPLIANDPHLKITIPNIWYEVKLKLADKFEVRGMLIPGTPVISIGANEHYAWGITALQADNQDIVVITDKLAKKLATMGLLEIHEDTLIYRDGTNKKQYHFQKGYLQGVGPLIGLSNGNYLFLKWTQEVPSFEPLAFLNINQGENLEDFRQALRLVQTPLAFVYADKMGNIGFFSAGLIPRRNYSSNIPRKIAKLDQLEDYNWQFYEPAVLPFQLNPESGYIVSANNPPLIKDGVPFPRGRYSPGFRARRIADLLNLAIKSGTKLEPRTIARIQTDTYSIYADILLHGYFERIADDVENLKPKEREVLDILRGWDRRMDKESQGALLFRLLCEKLKQIAMRKHRIHFAVEDAVLSALTTSQATFTFSQRELLEALSYSAEKGFTEAGTALKYGDLHRLKLVHPLPMYAPLSPGEVPASGGFRTVNVSVESFKNGVFYKDFGPSCRIIVGLKNPLESFYSVIPGGQSGSPLGTHFADQLELYTHGNYKYLMLK